MFGDVENELELSWEQFDELPRSSNVQDIHCVTRWSKFDTRFEGVHWRELAKLARPKPTARFVIAHAEHGFTVERAARRSSRTTSACSRRTATASRSTPDHGYPLRLVIPGKYFWKSAKWLRGIELSSVDKPGFWERYGYNNDADPWKEAALRVLNPSNEGSSLDRPRARRSSEHQPSPDPLEGPRKRVFVVRRQRKGAALRPPASSCSQLPRGEVALHHPAHVRHAAAHSGACLLRSLGDDRLGGEDVLRDRRGVLQRRAGDHRRVGDAGLDEVGHLAGVDVQTLARLRRAHLLDDDRALEARRSSRAGGAAPRAT